MKQIINNKLYDTEVATYLCDKYSVLSNNSKLYVTKSGMFFFQHQNPLSKEYYLQITPIDDAKILLSQKNTDAYITFFGDVEEA